MTKIWSALLSLLFSGIILHGFAQQNLELDKQLLLKVSPLSFLEPETMVFQGGVEYFFNPKTSVQSELGVNGGIFGIPAGRNKNEEMNLWRLRSEIKFHSKKNYWGIEFFTVQKNFIRVDDSHRLFRRTVWYERAQIDFQVYGGALKIGRQVYTSRNILIDQFVGLGFRSRFRTVNMLEISNNQNPEFFENFSFSDRYQFDGWDSVPHFTLGLKVGIVTGKN